MLREDLERGIVTLIRELGDGSVIAYKATLQESMLKMYSIPNDGNLYDIETGQRLTNEIISSITGYSVEELDLSKLDKFFMEGAKKIELFNKTD